jgi:hypothetical protein
MAKLKSYQSAEGALRKMIVQAIAIDDKYRDLFDSDDLHPTIWRPRNSLQGAPIGVNLPSISQNLAVLRACRRFIPTYSP